jgi:hypothetical protein
MLASRVVPRMKDVTRRLLLLSLALSIAMPARADESFKDKDGVVWSVRRDPSVGNAQVRTSLVHVLRAGREVGLFSEGGWHQTNPTMMGSSSCRFEIDAHGAPLVTTTVSETKRTSTEAGVTDSRTTTTTLHTWNGTAFVAGKPARTTSKTP